jgi:signal transduction histidine kinase
MCGQARAHSLLGMATSLTEQPAAVRPIPATDDTELGWVLDAIVERGRALVSARAMVVLILDGEELAVAATAGDLDAEVDGLRFPSASRVRDVLNGHRASGRAATEDASALVAPLVFGGSPLGVMVALDRIGGRPYGQQDEGLLKAFAASAATAVATAQSVAEDRLQTTIEAAENERGRWAKELQADTLQGLAALRVSLSTALHQRSTEALERAGEEAITQIEVEIEKLRALIIELRPAALDEIGLEAALRGLAERSAIRAGVSIEAHFELNGGLDSPALETTVYRLVQEGLTNVAKHANAETVELNVRTAGDSLTVLVRDDGIGFEPSNDGRGFGLRGMRERVKLARGRMMIDSSPGSGTAIRAELPLREPERSDLDQPAVDRVAN